ncbi:hypothetical protein [Bacillus stercoris]|uniref:hypothetical protein n=1 Tax=Bacillus stercoris TaxID=2054641 RepID=UPI003CF29578
MSINFRIEEAKNHGNRKENRYHIYIERKGISFWNMPYLKQAKLDLCNECYEIWSRDAKDEVLSDFIALYGEEFKKLANV